MTPAAMVAPALVVFDCDGVLVDSERISAATLARELTAVGLPTTPEQARTHYQGLTTRETIVAAGARRGQPLPDNWRATFEAAEIRDYRADLSAVDGVRDVLEDLEVAGIPRCVASQGTLALSELKLTITGLRRFFGPKAIFSGERVPQGKPHPDLFLLAAQSFDVAPARCVVIEDTPSGAVGAVAAGMPVLGYIADPHTDAPGLERAGALLFSAMSALLGLLGLDA